MPYSNPKRFLHVCTQCGKERLTCKKKNPSGLCRACAYTYAYTLRPSLLERFWASVEKTDTCWLWTAATTQGYGVLGDGYALVRVHRLSYILHIGPIPLGLHVLHRCDVRACVNPEHLFLGTNLDNINDMVQKKRHWMATPRLEQWAAMHRALQDHPELRMRGIQHHAAKTTEDQVREIRRLFRESQGKYGIQSQLARQFAMTESTISSIVRGKTWTHILD